MVDTRLKTFLTLLEEKSYTNTAKKLYITQPAVTHHIKSLESDNNITLFKDTKTFELTKAGILLKEYAQIAIQHFNQFEAALSKQGNRIIANFAMTPMTAFCINDLPHFQDNIKNTKVRLNQFEYNYEIIMDKLREGQIDFAIIDNSFDSAIYDSFYLTKANLCVVCKADGQYKDLEKITRDLANQATIVLGSEDSGLYRSTTEALRDKNLRFKNNIIIYGNCVHTLVNQILNYDALGFVYEESIRNELESGVLKKVNLFNFEASQNVYLIFNRTSFLNNETVELIESIRSSLDD